MQKGKLKPFLSLPYIHVNYSFIAGCLYPRTPHSLYPTWPCALRVMPLPTGPAASWTPSVIVTLFERGRVITATTLSILGNLLCSKISPENTGSATQRAQNIYSSLAPPEHPTQNLGIHVPSPAAVNIFVVMLPAPWLVGWNPPEAVRPHLSGNKSNG